MPFTSRRAQLELSSEDKELLTRLSQSRSETAAKVQRAQVLLRYHRGETISSIARALLTNRPKVERCVGKALELGVRQALSDLPGRGRRKVMDQAAQAWVVTWPARSPRTWAMPRSCGPR